MAFFLFVAELDFARDDRIVDLRVGCARNGHVFRGRYELDLQVLG